MVGMTEPTTSDRTEDGAMAGVSPPPAYSETPQQAGAPALDDQPPPKPDLHAPPPYEEEDSGVHPPHTGDIQPPSYEEVQRLKAMEVGEDLPMPLCHGGSAGVVGPGGAPGGVRVLRVSSLGGLDPETAEIAEEQLLGTDFMFFVAFAAAFVFNWVGFVLLLCFCHTVAGRTGALAGFGLSLAKWAVIVRHSTDLLADSNTWLIWLIMALGLLICLRAVLQYIQAKREWHHLPHTSRHRFFLFY